MIGADMIMMTMAVSFLELPTELLVRIFCDLNVSDLVSCQLCHSSLCAIISQSVLISYCKAIQVAGVEDNPYSKLPISDRLNLLNTRENSWKDFRIDFKQSMAVNHDPSGIYDLTGGIYLLGDRSSRTLHYLTLPTRASDITSWSKIDIDRSLVDLALAIYEHDLIAIITTTPHEANGMHMIEIVLLKFSTGQPHPLARHPRILVTESEWPRPAIGMEIAGENLALVITYFRGNPRPDDRLYVYEWKTGLLKMDIIAPCGCYHGLIFLTPQVLLLPNALEGVLEIWNIPSNPNITPARLICALRLPTLRAGHFIGAISCRSEPNPTGSGMPYSTKPFHSSPKEAIVIFNVRIQGLGVPGTIFSMFVHRRALLELCPDNAPSQVSQPDASLGPNITPWELWGPAITRWVDEGVIPTRWITTTDGQRCAVRFSRNPEEPSTIVVLDFNPMSVKRAMARSASSRQVSCVIQPTKIDHISFQVPVLSTLPYACYASPVLYRYDGLLMDDERLIGLRIDILDRITRIDVLHLGFPSIENKADQDS